MLLSMSLPPFLPSRTHKHSHTRAHARGAEGDQRLRVAAAAAGQGAARGYPSPSTKTREYGGGDATLRQRRPLGQGVWAAASDGGGDYRSSTTRGATYRVR